MRESASSVCRVRVCCVCDSHMWLGTFLSCVALLNDSPRVDHDAAEVHPQSLRTNKYTVRVRPHGAIPFWVAVLDQGGSEAVDQIAIFPIVLLRLSEVNKKSQDISTLGL